MLLNALMKPDEISRYYTSQGMAFHLIPDEISLGAFYQVLLRRPDYLLKFWISLMVSGAIVFGQLAVSVLGGFAFAKYSFRGKRLAFFVLIVLILQPLHAILVPNYIVFDALGLIDTWWPLIVPGILTPFGTILMTQVFKSVPNEIIEAARLDGAGTLRVIIQIVSPMGKGGLVSLVLLTFIDAWSMVEQPVTFLSDQLRYPLGVFMAYFNAQNVALSFACGVLACCRGCCCFCTTVTSWPRVSSLRAYDGGKLMTRTKRIILRIAVFLLLLLLVGTVLSRTVYRLMLPEVTILAVQTGTMNISRDYRTVILDTPDDGVPETDDPATAQPEYAAELRLTFSELKTFYSTETG
jgi:multiple sugar transport system permease protein